MNLSTIQQLVLRNRSRLNKMDESIFKIPIVTTDMVDPKDGQMWILKTPVIPDPVKPDTPSVVIDDINNTVAGMTTDMEYNLDGAGYVTYDASIFNAINFGGNHTLLVRIRAMGINPCSDVETLAFNTGTEVYMDTMAKTPLTKQYPFTLGITPVEKRTAIIFQPTKDIILDNVDFSFYTLNNASLHNKANPITIKLCPAPGNTPNESNILETVSVVGIATIDTFFTRNAKFLNNVTLTAGTKYAFLFSTSGTQVSYYYTAGLSGNNSVANYGGNAYGSGAVAAWQGFDDTIESNITIRNKTV